MKFLIVLSAIVALSAAMPGYIAGVGYPGLGYSGLGYSGLGYPGLGYSGLGYSGLGYSGLHGLGYAAYSPVAVGLSSQYHAQDELGQYSYGYSGGPSAKSEVKTFDGVTRGGYSYVDGDGKVQSVSYTADALNGFQVKATNLPKAPEPIEAPALVAPEPVEDTPEVAKAKASHLAAVEEAKVVSSIAPVAPVVHSVYSGIPHGGAFAYSTLNHGIYSPHLVYPGVVPADTPEVAAAKVAHAAAHHEAKVRNLG